MGKIVTQYPVETKHTRWEILLPPESPVTLITLKSIAGVNAIPDGAEVFISRPFHGRETEPVKVVFTTLEKQ